MTDQGGRLLMTLPTLACPVLIISGSSRRPRWPLSAWRVLQPANVQCFQALSCATQLVVLVMAVQWWPGLMNADWCSCALPKCSDSHQRLSFSLFGPAPAGLQLSTELFPVEANAMMSKCEYLHTKAHDFVFAIYCQ